MPDNLDSSAMLGSNVAQCHWRTTMGKTLPLRIRVRRFFRETLGDQIETANARAAETLTQLPWITDVIPLGKRLGGSSYDRAADKFVAKPAHKVIRIDREHIETASLYEYQFLVSHGRILNVYRRRASTSRRQAWRDMCHMMLAEVDSVAFIAHYNDERQIEMWRLPKAATVVESIQEILRILDQLDQEDRAQEEEEIRLEAEGLWTELAGT